MPQSSKYNQKPIVSKLRVGILGVGAIGSMVAVNLFRNENLEMYYFLRHKKERIDVQAHDSFFSFFPKNSKTIAADNQLDWLIICLKEYHFEGAKDSFQKLIFPKTKIAVIRNGLDLKKPLLPYSADSQILECMVDCSVQPDANGIYQIKSRPKIAMPKSELATDFETIFTKSFIHFFQVEDFKTAAWKKLIESAAIGAITCLENETCRIFQKKEMQNLYLKMVQEGIQVAKADGAIISENFPKELLEKLKKYPPEKGSSMLTDLRLGRKIELGAKNEMISRLGKKYGVETPLHDNAIKLLS